MKALLLSLILLISINAQQTKKIFGFMPDYDLPAYEQYIRYDRLTHLAAFTFYFDSTGTVYYPYDSSVWNGVKSKISTTSVKFIMSIFANNEIMIDSLSRTTAMKTKFYDSLVNEVNKYNFNGVNIDFEGLTSAIIWNNLAVFMKELTDEMHLRKGSDFEVSFSAPVMNWENKFDLEKMVNSCDYTFIMGYDFAGSWSENAWPVSPLNGYSSIQSSLEGNKDLINYKNIVKNTPQKLILGLPFYGGKWHTKTDKAKDVVKTNGWQGHIYYKDAKELINNGKVSLWDIASQTPYMVWQEDTNWVQVWYDNPKSLKLKMNLAQKLNLGGIGFWSLGQEGNDNEMWDTVYSYLNPVSIEDDYYNLPYEYKLIGNYPNPFNPSTKIVFSIGETCNAYLTVFNLLGQELYREEIGKFGRGVNEYKLDLSAISSGRYYYRLKLINEKLEQKDLFGKLILLK